MRFLEERINELIRQIGILRYTTISEKRVWKAASSTYGLSYEEWKERSFQETMKDGDRWGEGGKYWAFQTTVNIPEEFQDKAIEFYLTTGREGLWDATNPQFLLYVDGKPVQGMDVNHREVLLGNDFRLNSRLNFFLMAYSGENTGGLFLNSDIRVLDTEIEKYYYDLLVPFQAVCLMEKDDGRYYEILQILDHALNILDLRAPHSNEFCTSMAESSLYLEKEFYEKKCGNFYAEVYCVGHTHIDVAWLWTLTVTRDKAVRSFTTVVKLMEQYPEYIFMSSQPQLYQYVKEDAPELFEKIRKLVKEGRWEAEGGMWLEPDCNIPSGESFVRQFIYGKRFFRNEFGVENEILWLPDVFGYSAALPQIMLQSGIHYFMTTKLSWNEENKMPYDTFYWKGIDGSRVLTHFIPTRDYHSETRHPVTTAEHTTEITTNYNGYPHPSQVKGAWQRYQQKYLNEEVLFSYGFGDGGGGPTKWMIESILRLNRALPEVPKTRFSTAGEFFHKLEKSVAENPATPVWDGELYLENHRATYTGMARNKRFNRKAEFLLTNAEYLASVTGIYDKEKYDGAWIKILRNQFHDILPGSCIEEVYEESRKEYQSVFDEFDSITEALAQKAADEVPGEIGEIIAFNFNGTRASGIVFLKDECKKALLSSGIPTQNSCENELMIRVQDIPAKGYVALTDESYYLVKSIPKISEFTDQYIENKYYRIRLNDVGQMISFYDREAERELLQEGFKGNVFMTYEDKPHESDNWNIYEYYKEKCWEVNGLTSKRIIETGPVRYGLEFTYRYMSSSIRERMFFYPDQRNIDMEIDIDWKEDQILLKLLYPIELYTRSATFEIQYGNVTRNMIKNTSWDLAKFEVCCHKWMDISENNGYGISFLNDCKFGLSIDNNVVGLSIIKSGMYPNAHADREHHHLLYSIYPHMGNWRDAETVEKAYMLNNPLLVCCKKSSGEAFSHFAFQPPENKNIITEVIKPAEDGKGLIVRLYECHGIRSKVYFAMPDGYNRVFFTNLIENDGKELVSQSGSCNFWMSPYQIVTLRFIQ